MTIHTIQTITNVLNEQHEIIRSMTTETYVLYPAEGKALKDIVSGKIFTSSVSVSIESKIKNYIEIDV